GAMQASGDVNVLTAGVLSSHEYFARNGGDPALWVRSLYADVLGRSPDIAGWNAWTAGLHAGLSRAAVATGFVTSHEAHQIMVKDAYAVLLQRAPETQGSNYWTGSLNGGMTIDEMMADIAASAEFQQLVNKGMFPPTSSQAGTPPAANQHQAI